MSTRMELDARQASREQPFIDDDVMASAIDQRASAPASTMVGKSRS